MATSRVRFRSPNLVAIDGKWNVTIIMDTSDENRKISDKFWRVVQEGQYDSKHKSKFMTNKLGNTTTMTGNGS